MAAAGTLVPLDPVKRPGCRPARSDAADTARVESRASVCAPTEAEAGPDDNWAAPAAMRRKLRRPFDRYGDRLPPRFEEERRARAAHAG